MSIGSESLVSGPYTVTWNSVDLGVQEGDSGLPRLEHSTKAEAIANTSAYGKSTIDEIEQGADFFISMTLIEYKTGPKAAFWPYSAVLGRMGVTGRLLYSISQALVLTAVAGTSASASPATLTAAKTILMPGFSTSLVYGPTLRKVPIRFRLYPSIVSANGCWFTET